MNYESKSRAQLIKEIERLREKTAVFEALQVEGEPIQSPQRVDKKYSEPKAGDDSSSTDRIRVSGINIEWDPVKGVCTFENLPVAMMWIDTTLSGLMSGVQSMVGTKRFNLALQSEGRKSVEEDWRFISQFSDFKEGFKAIANIAAVAGWGVWKLISINKKKKRCIYRVWNSWEGLYQKTLGVCWGSGMLAGKMAGYCTKLFKTNCWAKQTAFITEGDQYDEFSVVPSDRSLENEIENLLTTDEATRADMAVALKKLQDEILERKRAEEGLKVSEEKYRAIFESFQDVYYQNDTQGRLTVISPSVRQYGYEPDEILGCFAADFYNNPSDFEAVNEKLKENGVLKDCEIHLKHRHGKMIDASLTARMVYDKESRWIGT